MAMQRLCQKRRIQSDQSVEAEKEHRDGGAHAVDPLSLGNHPQNARGALLAISGSTDRAVCPATDLGSLSAHIHFRVVDDLVVARQGSACLLSLQNHYR